MKFKTCNAVSVLCISFLFFCGSLNSLYFYKYRIVINTSCCFGYGKIIYSVKAKETNTLVIKMHL